MWMIKRENDPKWFKEETERNYRRKIPGAGEGTGSRELEEGCDYVYLKYNIINVSKENFSKFKMQFNLIFITMKQILMLVSV